MPSATTIHDDAEEPSDEPIVLRELRFVALSATPPAIEEARSLPTSWTGSSITRTSRTPRVAFDFGVGEQRYDDGVRSLEPLPVTGAGFSDSVLQMGFSGSLAPGAKWTSGIAAIRHQDEPILDDIDETEIGWVTVGVHFQF